MDLNKCENLTDDSIAYIQKFLPSLETIALNYCPNITDHSIEELKKKNKKVRVLRNVTKPLENKDVALKIPLPIRSVYTNWLK